MKMHITEGKYRGAESVYKRSIRFMRIKTRNAIFEILGEKIIGARILDLFCGSGFVSIDALSRGAKSAIMNDIALKHLAIAKKNCELINVQEDIKFSSKDGSKIKIPLDEIDIIFICPPYPKPNLLYDSILNIKLRKPIEKKIICCCDFA